MASDPIPIYNITKLGDDMVMEILVRLPCYKIAMMCRSVCKRWFTIISHHNFGNRFRHHHQSKESKLPTTNKRKRIERYESVFGWKLTKLNMSSPNPKKHHHCVFLLEDRQHKEVLWYMAGSCFKTLDFSITRLPMYKEADLRVVSACKDLILCMSIGSGIDKYKVYPNQPYFIYNLFTNQGNWLPPPPTDLKYCPTIGLICEPYLNAHDSYRYWVVFFDGKDATTEELEVRMFSSTTRKWSRFFVSSPKAMRKRPHKSIFVIGRKIYTYSSTTGILGFDPCKIDDTTSRRGTDGEEKHVIKGHFIEWPSVIFNKNYLDAGIALKSCSDDEGLLLSELDFKFTTACLRVWSLELNKKNVNGRDWLLEHNMRLHLLENYDTCFTGLKVLSCGFILLDLIGFHQTDADVVYLVAGRRIIVMCNLRQGKMQLVGTIPDNVTSLNSFWTTLPLWPTPLL